MTRVLVSNTNHIDKTEVSWKVAVFFFFPVVVSLFDWLVLVLILPPSSIALVNTISC